MGEGCLICYEEQEVWVLPPCGHEGICWKCCLQLVDSQVFSCPFCKYQSDQHSKLLFVTTREMKESSYERVFALGPYRSTKNALYYYSNQQVANYVEGKTSLHCGRCGEVFRELNQLRKHMDKEYQLQFCDVCLDNRKCLLAEQRLYTETEVQKHLKQGECSESGELVMYHPWCRFCNRQFYDLEAFREHLRKSAHVKCDICDLNSSRLKHVYYRDYADLERHHHKSHFVCDIGDCVGRILQNVFVSEGMLEEHKRACHRKYKGKQGAEKISNLLLGFNQSAEEDSLQFDGIGHDFAKEFQVFERQYRVEKEEHHDDFIDIRDFYQEQTKSGCKLRPDDITDKLHALSSRNRRATSVNFTEVPLFRPLEMPSMTRVECERMLRKGIGGRDAEPVIDIFFSKRNEYKSGEDFFAAIERKLKSGSLYAFFLLFPQLVRFMRDENRNKLPMDAHYARKLRTLQVSREFIFHQFDRYSQVLEFLREAVVEEVRRRVEGGKVDLQGYCKYMREMSAHYYLQQQDELFFVSREKMTNLRQMIDRTKTRDFLKLSWLLKLGFSQQSAQYINRQFYFQTRADCQNEPFKDMVLRELALLNAYTDVCIESIISPHHFEAHKRQPQPYFLSGFIQQHQLTGVVGKKVMGEIVTLEGHSQVVQKSNRTIGSKPVMVHQDDCPSLLNVEPEYPTLEKTKDEHSIGIGKSRLPIWNEERRKDKKEVKSKSVVEDFPTLSGGGVVTSKGRKKIEEIDDEQFPAFSFEATKVPVKKEGPKAAEFISFNKKTIGSSNWNEERTRERLMDKAKEQKKAQEQQERELKQKKNRKKKKDEPRVTKKPEQVEEEDEYLKLAIAESLKTAAAEQGRKNGTKAAKKQEEVRVYEEPKKEELIVYKKETIQDEPEGKKKRKRKGKDSKESNVTKEKPKEEEETLFGAIEREKEELIQYQHEQEEKKEETPPKSLPVSIFSDDEEDIVIKRETKAKPKKAVVLQEDDFESLVQPEVKQEQSIVNKLIKESAKDEEEPGNRKKVKGRKGKKVTVERVNFFQL